MVREKNRISRDIISVTGGCTGVGMRRMQLLYDKTRARTGERKNDHIFCNRKELTIVQNRKRESRKVYISVKTCLKFSSNVILSSALLSMQVFEEMSILLSSLSLIILFL